MAATTKTWLNNNPPTCEDADLNGFKNENNNAIVGSGQALNTGDLQQTHKAMVVFSSVGNFYADSGAANAYVLSAVAPRLAAPALINGMIVRFVAANPSTGASTLNYNGTGALAIVRPGGTALSSGDIANEVTVQYDAANTRWIVLGLAPDSATEIVGFVVSRPITYYTGNSFSVAAQATDARQLAFNTDGTRMFILDGATDTVFEYSLSVRFDLSSTVAYTGNSFSFAAQDTSPTGIAFNTTGTRMFIIGDGSDSVYEYSLSVGFDLGSTVAYTGNTFVVSAQTSSADGLAFNADGTRMYTMSRSPGTVYEYSLSVGFDLGSTVAYTGNSFSVNAEISTPQNLAFNTAGTRMLVSGTTDVVYEYSLTVGFDLGSTVAYTGNNFSVVAQSSNMRGLAFSTNGGRMFTTDPALTDTVFEYNSNFVRSVA